MLSEGGGLTVSPGRPLAPFVPPGPSQGPAGGGTGGRLGSASRTQNATERRRVGGRPLERNEPVRNRLPGTSLVPAPGKQSGAGPGAARKPARTWAPHSRPPGDRDAPAPTGRRGQEGGETGSRRWERRAGAAASPPGMPGYGNPHATFAWGRRVSLLRFELPALSNRYAPPRPAPPLPPPPRRPPPAAPRPAGRGPVPASLEEVSSSLFPPFHPYPKLSRAF
ncbi:basic proline-rich protein-like [Mustela erminea]|uniref:basic proline-rich protein-like n=1 Tax=Mustela erminea TaxID=36723 RepID=UPI001387249B|nr:basic proline-rich protein-like [Mustela erminea]